MIRRSINARFEQPVLAGIKTTTIRENPWPVSVPIQIFRWSGIPYRSKQINVAVIEVNEVTAVKITHKPDGDMLYAYGTPNAHLLHETEGFTSRADMDAWFRPLVKPGQTLNQHLMRFRLLPIS